MFENALYHPERRLTFEESYELRKKGLKRCANCKVVKNVEVEFHMSKQEKDGHAIMCKICNRENVKHWRTQNRRRNQALGDK